MPQTRDYDLLTMGRSSIDLYAHQIGVPMKDVSSFDAYVGGCPTNICVGSRRLGVKATLLTAVGDDELLTAIGFAGSNYSNPGVREVPLALQSGQPFIAVDSVEASRGQYPLIRPLQLVVDQTPGKPLPTLEAEFLKYVFSRFGQEDVVRAGMHPIGAQPAELSLGAVGLGSIK